MQIQRQYDEGKNKEYDDDLHRDSFHPIGKDSIRDRDTFEAIPKKICISVSAVFGMSLFVN